MVISTLKLWHYREIEDIHTWFWVQLTPGLVWYMPSASAVGPVILALKLSLVGISKTFFLYRVQYVLDYVLKL